MTWGRRVAYGLATAFVVAQLIRVERTNPPVDAEIVAEPQVRPLLRRACYDCHSHETAWPWYTWVAPVSWLVTHDVNHGREELDFSRFESYEAAKQLKSLRESAKEVEEGEMPLWYYVLLHPDARLGDEERRLLLNWANAEVIRRGRNPGTR
jgi:hypothetical protein